MIHIDVSVVLRRRVSEYYSDLVTRPTGAAVRAGIEEQLAGSGGVSMIVIDFSNVGLLDFSCADEIVAKLLLRCHSADSGVAGERYFLVRGLSEDHLEAIEQVLERQGLALVAEEFEGAVRLVGAVDEPERLAWESLRSDTRPQPDRVAEELSISASEAARLLERLHHRRLCMRKDDLYVSFGGNVS